MTAQEIPTDKEIVERRDFGTFLSHDFFPGMIEGMGFSALEGLTAQGLTDAVFADIQRLHSACLTDEILLISSLPKYMLSRVPERLWQQVNQVRKITSSLVEYFNDGDSKSALLAGPDMDLKLRLHNGTSITDVFTALLSNHDSANVNRITDNTYEVSSSQSPWKVSYELIDTMTSNSNFGRLRMIYSYDDTRIFHADVTAFGQDNQARMKDARIGLTSDMQDLAFAILDVSDKAIACNFRQTAVDVMKSNAPDAIIEKPERTKEELAEIVFRALRYAFELKTDIKFDITKFMPWFRAHSAFNIIRGGFRDHLHEDGSFEFSQEKLHILMKEVIVMFVENPFDAIRAFRDIAVPFIPYIADFSPNEWFEILRSNAFLVEDFREARDAAYATRDAEFINRQRKAYIDGGLTDGFQRFIDALREKFKKSKRIPMHFTDEAFFVELWKDGFRSFEGYPNDRIVTIVTDVIKTENTQQLREILEPTESMNLSAAIIYAILADNPGGLTRDEIAHIYTNLNPKDYKFTLQDGKQVLLYLKKLGLINRTELGRFTSEGEFIPDIGFYYSRNTAGSTTNLEIEDVVAEGFDEVALREAVVTVNTRGFYLEEAILAVSKTDYAAMEIDSVMRGYLSDAIELLKKYIESIRLRRRQYA